jgi:hypothetical protein
MWRQAIGAMAPSVFAKLNEPIWWETPQGEAFLAQHNGEDGHRNVIHMLILQHKAMLGTIIATTRSPIKSLSRYAKQLLGETPDPPAYLTHSVNLWSELFS